jgi:hypothetical protein
LFLFLFFFSSFFSFLCLFSFLLFLPTFLPPSAELQAATSRDPDPPRVTWSSRTGAHNLPLL